MKLKTLVVASMSVLGMNLMSYPAFSASPHTQNHYSSHTHQHVTNHSSYKGMGALQPVEVCPINDFFTATLDVMDHNIGRAKPTTGCNKPIAFAGGANFDAKWGNRSMGYQGENTQRLSLNDAYLNVFGNVNDWTKAFASFSYSDTENTSVTNRIASSRAIDGEGAPVSYSNVYDANTLTMEQGFIRFANFDQAP